MIDADVTEPQRSPLEAVLYILLAPVLLPVAAVRRVLNPPWIQGWQEHMRNLELRVPLSSLTLPRARWWRRIKEIIS